jgi:uncharacterized OB-fold protein
MRAPTHVPLPQPDPVTEPFWTGCAARRLLIQRCVKCGNFQSPPRIVCRSCGGSEFDWCQSEGRGRVYTYTIAHHAAAPALRDQVPYVVVVVKLDDCSGVLLISNLVGENAGSVAVGRAVRLLWDNDAGAWLPRFELAKDGVDHGLGRQ